MGWSVSGKDKGLQERPGSVAPRAWLLVPVSALGLLWVALGVNWAVLGLMGFTSLIALLAIAALREQNEDAPFPLLADVLIGVIFSLWVRWLLAWLFRV